MACKQCNKTVCNCPPKEQVGCVVPCIENKLDFSLGTFPNTCTDVRTSDIESARLLIQTPTPSGSKILWHKDTINNPSSFDLSPTFNIRAILEPSDTVEWAGNLAYYYELFVVFNGETEEQLLVTGNLCVEKLQSRNLAPLGVTVDYERTGRHFIFTTTVNNPHAGYQLKDFVWDFGDGVTQTTTNNVISHLYTEDATFNPCVTVTYETTLASSTNPCATNVTGELCFIVEPCILDLNLRPNPTPTTLCEGRFLDKQTFYDDYLVTGLVPFPLTWDITLEVNGITKAQNTLLTVTALEDITVDGSNNVQNITDFLNNLDTPLGFASVTNGSYTGLEVTSPSPLTTFTLRIVKSYSALDEYIYTEAGYTGDVFTTPVVFTCNPIP